MNEVFSLTDENGKLKSKEEVMAAVEEMYDTAQKASDKEFEDYLSLITDTEEQVDIEAVTSTSDFYSRSIYITEEITDATANRINRLIRLYNKIDLADNTEKEERIPIHIYINTCGGDLDAGFSIISSILNSVTPVFTYNIGKAWSCGFFILICGDVRYGTPYSSYLFHEGSIITGGDAHKFIQQAKFYECQLQELKELVLNCTEISEEYYEQHRPDDLWFMADDALEYGVIDGIINSYYPLTVISNKGDKEDNDNT